MILDEMGIGYRLGEETDSMWEMPTDFRVMDDLVLEGRDDIVALPYKLMTGYKNMTFRNLPNLRLLPDTLQCVSKLTLEGLPQVERFCVYATCGHVKVTDCPRLPKPVRGAFPYPQIEWSKHPPVLDWTESGWEPEPEEETPPRIGSRIAGFINTMISKVTGHNGCNR